MTILIKCPACQTSLRVREEYAGKRMKCPKCQGPVPVPAARDDPGEEPPILEGAGTVACPECGKANPAAARFCGFCRTSLVDEEEPVRRKSKFKPCPNCGAYGAKRVAYTLWGSFYGPSMCTHVRCPECGYAYNGRTGEPNTIWIVLGSIVQAICLILIIALVIFCIYMLGTAFKAK